MKKTLFIMSTVLMLVAITSCKTDLKIHQHTYSKEWSSDENYHWYECTASDCQEEKARSLHIFGEWIANNNATVDQDGTKSRVCKVCNYKETVVDEGTKIPTYSYNYKTYVKDGSCHCLVTKDTAGNSTVGDKEAHTFENGVCKVCGMPVDADTMVYIDGGYTVLDFYISNTEVTYKRWLEVYQWAVQNGYLFANYGREGSFGIEGNPRTEINQPVTNISWRDAVVWCNAASEMEGFTPVYYLKGTIDFTNKDNVLKISERGTNNVGEHGTNVDNPYVVEGSKGGAELAVINKNANGYRLPTGSEWEYAAKGGEKYKYAGSDELDSIAWYKENSGGVTHPVTLKKANAYGLYDMTGNVDEWSQDEKGGLRKIRGGDCFNSEEPINYTTYTNAIEYSVAQHSYNKDICIGFRPVRNAK